jgi:ubiquinone/menaquinone biosynthesis C-methylase UbiE
MKTDTDNTRSSYDRVAKAYAEYYVNEFDHKPLDRELLNRLVSRVQGKGRVCDLGCGPGMVAAYLHARGAEAMGIDLSPGMVEQARQAHPGIEFRQGDMRALPLPEESLAGIAAFYSIIHIPRQDVTAVLMELRRVLQPGGAVLLAFHLGDEVRHVEEMLGLPVSVDVTFFQTAEMGGYLREAGFVIEEALERDPYPDVEYQGRRGYIFASKQG